MSKCHPRLRQQLDFDGFTRLSEAEVLELDLPHRSKKLNAEQRNSFVLLTLESLGLAIYRSPATTTLLLGLEDASLAHPHDRWLYRYTEYPSDKLTWLNVHDEKANIALHGNTMHSDVIEELHTLARLCDVTRTMPGGAQLTNAEILARYQMVNAHYEVQLIAEMNPAVNLRETHQMIYHWRKWRRQHPEFDDMTRELIFRMHGLEALLIRGFGFRLPPG